MTVKTAIGLALTFVFGSYPALANETATATQIAGAVESANRDLNGTTQEEFGELFASWKNLDNGGRITAAGNIAAAPHMAVSVPSRMPVDGIRLTSSYGMREHPVLGGRRQHNGVDLAAPTGTPVYATGDGRVGMAQYYGSYGNYVQIEHGGRLETRYAHLSSYTVSAGAMVSKGDLIGYIGSTGRSTGPHLHYEVRVEGQPVDPRPFMTAQYASLQQVDGAIGGPDGDE